MHKLSQLLIENITATKTTPLTHSKSPHTSSTIYYNKDRSVFKYLSRTTLSQDLQT